MLPLNFPLRRARFLTRDLQWTTNSGGMTIATDGTGNGNNRATCTNTATYADRVTTQLMAGGSKYYFEGKVVVLDTNPSWVLGVQYNSTTPPSAGNGNEVGRFANSIGISFLDATHGLLYAAGSLLSTGFTVAVSDIYGFAVDQGTGKVWVHRNGTYFSGDPSAGTSPSATLSTGSYSIVFEGSAAGGSGSRCDLYARTSGQLTYTIPTGFILPSST